MACKPVDSPMHKVSPGDTCMSNGFTILNKTESEALQPAALVPSTIYRIESAVVDTGFAQSVQLRPVAGLQEY